MSVIVYADGSCPFNGSDVAVGGWNFLIMKGPPNKPDQQVLIDSVSGYEPPNPDLPNTNIRMELKAVIEALKYFKEPTEVIIHSDSAYVVNGVNDKWYQRWFKTGLNSLGKTPANLDLWVELVDLVKQHTVKMVHVKGHSGHTWQELSDTFARQKAVGGMN
jgi:ribonuclease HI